MRPPVCDACGADVDPQEGLVTFVDDEPTAEFRRRSATPGFVGHPPNQGWFCPRHHAGARHLAGSTTLPDAVRRLADDGAAARTGTRAAATTIPGAVVDEPVIRPPASVTHDFLPAPDPMTSAETVVESQIAPRTARSVLVVVRAWISDLAESLDLGVLRSPGSSSRVSDDPSDRTHAPANAVTTVSSTRYDDDVGHPELFVVAARHHDGDRLGPVISEQIRVLVRGGAMSTLQVTVTPAVPPTSAGDGVVLLERVTAQAPPTPAADAAVRRSVERLVDDLRDPPIDPLDPAPDLVGVDLGTGTIARFGDDRSVVEWAPTALSHGEVAATMIDIVPALIGAVLGEPLRRPEFHATTERTWTPMDGARPPHCPFSETHRWTAMVDVVDRTGRSDNTTTGDVVSVDVDISDRASYWNELDVADRSVACSIRIDGRSVCLVTALADPESNGVRFTLSRPTTPAVVEIVRSVADPG